MKAKQRKARQRKAQRLTDTYGRKSVKKSDQIILGNPSMGRQDLMFRHGFVYITIPQGTRLPFDYKSTMGGYLRLASYNEKKINTDLGSVFIRKISGYDPEILTLAYQAMGISQKALMDRVSRMLNRDRLSSNN